MNFTVKPNFREVGKTLGSSLKEFQEKLLKLSIDEIKKLQKNEIIKMDIAGNSMEVTSLMVDIRIDAKDGFNVGMENNNFVILNTTLTKDLIEEGIAREIISKVQQMRKNIDLELTDRIIISYNSNEKVKDAVNNYSDYIMRETLAIDINFDEKATEEFTINDDVIKIAIKKK